MERRIKAVFLDAGGTILSVTKNRFERIREALLTRSVDIPIERIQELDREVREAILKDDLWISRPEQEDRFWTDYYRMMVERLGLTGDVKRLAQELKEKTFWVDWTFVYPDAIPVLKALKGRYKLGVISNAYPSMQDALDFTNLTPFMDSITLSAYVGVAKPHPLIYETALKSLGVEAAESIFVDDVEENIRAAEEMGFTVFLIDRNRKRSDPQVIHDLYAVLDFLGIPAPR